MRRRARLRRRAGALLRAGSSSCAAPARASARPAPASGSRCRRAARRSWSRPTSRPGGCGSPRSTSPLPLDRYLAEHGRPIAYGHLSRPRPLRDLQTVFADEPGSAEMPSAGRPFTQRVLDDLLARGVQVAPLVLHTGVASLERGERPYPERYRVPATTATRVNAHRAAGGRVIAVGTTVVRALETVAARDGRVEAGRRLDRPDDHARARRARDRRADHGLARARREPSPYARGRGRPRPDRALVRRGPHRRLSLARVRRLAPDPAFEGAAVRRLRDLRRLAHERRARGRGARAAGRARRRRVARALPAAARDGAQRRARVGGARRAAPRGARRRARRARPRAGGGASATSSRSRGTASTLARHRRRA